MSAVRCLSFPRHTSGQRPDDGYKNLKSRSVSSPFANDCSLIHYPKIYWAVKDSKIHFLLLPKQVLASAYVPANGYHVLQPQDAHKALALAMGDIFLMA